MDIYKRLNNDLKNNVDFYLSYYQKKNFNELIKELKKIFRASILQQIYLRNNKLTKRLIINFIKNNSIFI